MECLQLRSYSVCDLLTLWLTCRHLCDSGRCIDVLQASAQQQALE